jgi:hypothetical protein
MRPVFWAGRRWYAIDMGWADDLVAADPVARRAARDRFQAEEDARHARQRVVNEIWATAGSLDPAERRLAARMAAARAEQDRLDGRSLLRTLWDGWYVPASDVAELTHLSLRYLEWEAWYPGEWHRHWGTKAGLLAHLARASWSAGDRRRLEDLVQAAVARTHRCEDRRYVPLARALGGGGLRDRVAAAAAAGDPAARERAAYLLHHLDHPELPATAASWRRWLRAQPSPR